MKNKIIIIFAIIIGALLCCVGTVLSITQKSPGKTPTDPIEKDPNSKDKKPNLTSEEEGKIMEKIMEYGLEIYEDGSYLSLNEEEKYYYITLGELKEKGYKEIENLVYSCKDNDAIIYFYKNKEGSAKYPIAVKYYCGQDQ